MELVHVKASPYIEVVVENKREAQFFHLTIKPAWTPRYRFSLATGSKHVGFCFHVGSRGEPAACRSAYFYDLVHDDVSRCKVVSVWAVELCCSHWQACFHAYERNLTPFVGSIWIGVFSSNVWYQSEYEAIYIWVACLEKDDELDIENFKFKLPIGCLGMLVCKVTLLEHLGQCSSHPISWGRP